MKSKRLLAAFLLGMAVTLMVRLIPGPSNAIPEEAEGSAGSGKTQAGSVPVLPAETLSPPPFHFPEDRNFSGLEEVYRSASARTELKRGFARERWGEVAAGKYTERNAIHLLTVLRKLGKLAPPALSEPELKAMMEFYLELLGRKKTPWPLKRQALKNALFYSTRLEEKERDSLLRAAGPSVVALAARTDQEILKGLVAGE